MYPVSQAYREAMQAQFRQVKSRCRVYLGVFDSSAEYDGAFTNPEAVDYSTPDALNKAVEVSAEYATFEPGFFRLDGSMQLLPDNISAAKDQGWISEAQADEQGAFSDGTQIERVFSQLHSLIGLTLVFGNLPEDTPAQVTLLAYKGDDKVDEKSFTELTPTYAAEFPVTDIDRLVIRYDKGRFGYARARLVSVAFGIGYTWSDSQLISVNEKHTESPVALELPSAGLSFTVNNADGRFNVENDTALVRFLAEGQRVQVDYGIDLPSGTEWVPGGKWALETWSVADMRASFSATSLLSALTKTTYEKSVYSAEPVKAGDLIMAIGADAGLSESDFYIGPKIKDTPVYAPIPVMSPADCFQLIANLCQARLFIDRTGRISFKRYTESVGLTVQETKNTESFSDASSVLTGADYFSGFETEYFTLYGKQKLFPDQPVEKVENSGLTGSAVSVDGGLFEEGTELEVTVGDPKTAFDAYEVALDFGGQPPAEIGISALSGEWLPETVFSVSKNIQSFYVGYADISAVKVRILKARSAGQRGHIAKLSVGYGTGFTVEKREMFTGGSGTLDTKPKDVVGTWQLFTKPNTAEPDRITSVTLQTNSGWARIEHDLAVDISAKIVETDPVLFADVAIEEKHYGYVSYVNLTAPEDKTVDVELTGVTISTAEFQMSSHVNDSGEDLPVTNPLFGSAESVDTLAWVGEYYRNRVKRTLKIRGCPEVDTGDIIEVDGRRARVVDLDLTYNGAFNETLTVREG